MHRCFRALSAVVALLPAIVSAEPFTLKIACPATGDCAARCWRATMGFSAGQEPFVARIGSAGDGYVAARCAADRKRHEPINFYAAARAFAPAHPDVMTAFREAVAEASQVVHSDRDAANRSISKFTKLPPDVVLKTRPDVSDPNIKGDDLAWWIETMNRRGMLQNKLDLARLVLL